MLENTISGLSDTTNLRRSARLNRNASIPVHDRLSGPRDRETSILANVPPTPNFPDPGQVVARMIQQQENASIEAAIIDEVLILPNQPEPFIREMENLLANEDWDPPNRQRRVLRACMMYAKSNGATEGPVRRMLLTDERVRQQAAAPPRSSFPSRRGRGRGRGGNAASQAATTSHGTQG